MSGICKRFNFLILGFSFLSVPSFSESLPKHIVWPEHASHYHGRVSGMFYVQAGSFARKTNALRYQNHLHTLFKEPVTIQLQHQQYKVFIGPMHTVTQLRLVGKSLLTQKSHRKIKISALKKPIYSHARPLNPHLKPLPKSILAKSNWFISTEVGGQQVKLQPMTVGNGSGFPPPNDRDIYTGKSDNNQAFIGVVAGRRWQNESLWFPQYSLGLRYKYLFSKAVGGQVIQYSLPQFTNYNYTFKTTANALLLAGKLDIRRYNKFTPYVSAGAGTVFNRASSYSEMALPGITSRISPNFAGKNTNQFTYTLGAGLNYQATQKLNFALGYEFQDWGMMQTGNGTVGWADQSLSQPNYRSNALFLGIDYLFNN